MDHKLTNSLVLVNVHISFQELDPNQRDQLGEFQVTRNPQTMEDVVIDECPIKLCEIITKHYFN